MLEAIRGAQQTITFETYIYWSGDIGREFADALAERARAGVKVHVLLDWVGSQQDGRGAARRDEGRRRRGRSVTTRCTGTTSARINNRTHRKLLVVDGAIGFTGGVGIADQWTGNAQDPEHWRDSHFRVEGPVVAQMQAVLHGQLDQGDRRGAARRATTSRRCSRAGGSAAQIFSSSPAGGSESMQLMYLLSIAAAERTIDLASAYFVPDELTRAGAASTRASAACRCASSCPGEHIDAEVVRRASRALWGDAAGGRRARSTSTSRRCSTARCWSSTCDGLGRLDQLRQPLVPAQRRGEPQRLRPGVRRAQVAIFEQDRAWRRPRHLRGVARTAGARS